MNSIIPSTITTPNLVVRDADIRDAEALKAICRSWSDKLLLEGEVFEGGYIEKCIGEGDLPPIENASRRCYQLKAICSGADAGVVGFLDVYHGYPNPSTIWISIFVVDTALQQHGVGGEVIEAIAAEGRKLGYTSLGIGVHLKNWKGLRFWHKNGFDRISRIGGDREYGADKFAVMFLERAI